MNGILWPSTLKCRSRISIFGFTVIGDDGSGCATGARLEVGLDGEDEGPPKRVGIAGVEGGPKGLRGFIRLEEVVPRVIRVDIRGSGVEGGRLEEGELCSSVDPRFLD